jgi:hypothetical protein
MRSDEPGMARLEDGLAGYRGDGDNGRGPAGGRPREDRTMRLLVIEDNRSLVANLFDYFEARGHTLDAAPDGPTGLHLATTQTYDAILLDWGCRGWMARSCCVGCVPARTATCRC